MITEIIYYGSFLVFPFLILLCFLWFKLRLNFLKIVLLVIFSALALLFVYARFVEPNLIVVKYDGFLFSHSDKKDRPIKMALFADAHLGVYKKGDFLKRIVEKVNNEKPDFVVIPGDFIFHLYPADLSEIFNSLSALEMPVYAVSGNHDFDQEKWNNSRIDFELVKEMLIKNKVNILDSERVALTFDNKTLYLYGLKDLWQLKNIEKVDPIDWNLLKDIRAEDNVIILAHNPDTAEYLEGVEADLIVSGHTHGGQIRIPFLYHRMIPSNFGYNQGWYFTNDINVYVTSGIGEVLLPMRLGVPPEIVMMDLYFN